MAAIEIQNISHSYGDSKFPLIKELSLKVTEGEIFGLFGPNGAGKTTLMSLITGVQRLQQGGITIFGEQHIHKHQRRKFGYVPQSLSFYEELSPMQNLKYFGSMMGMNVEELRERSIYLLQVLGLSEVAHKQVRKFSGGMQRRVNLAIGVVHNPPLLFLDEPTVGVDVQSRHAIIEYLKQLNEEGTTIFYTSHHLSEAQEFCTSVALMDEGKILAHNSMEGMLREYGETSLEKLFITLTGHQFRD